MEEITIKVKYLVLAAFIIGCGAGPVLIETLKTDDATAQSKDENSCRELIQAVKILADLKDSDKKEDKTEYKEVCHYFTDNMTYRPGGDRGITSSGFMLRYPDTETAINEMNTEGELRNNALGLSIDLSSGVKQDYRTFHQRILTSRDGWKLMEIGNDNFYTWEKCEKVAI